MIDDPLVLTVERLRDGLKILQSDMRKRYKESSRQVTAADIKQNAARIAEQWMVEIAPRRDVGKVLGQQLVAGLNVRFQRLLTLSEHASMKSKYDQEMKAILKNFTADVIIPLKQSRGTVIGKLPDENANKVQSPFRPTAFVGHSFDERDRIVSDSILTCIRSIGIQVVTGEKPRAERISDKVMGLIREQEIFVGVFTRRDKIARKKEYTTSPWVIDEKAYAYGQGKKLILLKEHLVGSIGGLQGDYEYIQFNRDRLDGPLLKILQMFDLTVAGLR